MRVSSKPAPQHNSARCHAIRDMLSLVGDKWSILIIAMLEDGTKRFSELQNAVEGISQRMLSRTLRELERYGLVTRTVEPTVPPSVYYALTEQGRTLLVPAKALAEWALDHYAQTEEAKARYDAKMEGA